MLHDRALLFFHSVCSSFHLHNPKLLVHPSPPVGEVSGFFFRVLPSGLEVRGGIDSHFAEPLGSTHTFKTRITRNSIL